jgi:hypothetical protein
MYNASTDFESRERGLYITAIELYLHGNGSKRTRGKG